jgi:DNA-binding transcriptional regulator YiaG
MTASEIRNARRRLRMSEADFGSAAGLKGKNRHISVYRWEVGSRTPSAQTIVLIKQLLGKQR